MDPKLLKRPIDVVADGLVIDGKNFFYFIVAHHVIVFQKKNFFLSIGKKIERISQSLFLKICHLILNQSLFNGDLDQILDRKSTRLNSSHVANSYAVFCLKKKKHNSMLYKK